MKDTKYMGGHGILRHTRELTDKMWDTVPFGFIGMVLMFAGPFVGWIVFIHHMRWEPPPTDADWLWGGIVSVVGLVGGYFVGLPWFRACRVLRQHTLKMERETLNRGPGWAQD